MGPRLRIVAVNDVYSLENLPRLKNLVLHHATVDPADRLVVSLAGDFVAPSILSSLDSGRGMVECMNDVGVTHAILGNHEDDIPTIELRTRIMELHARLLVTNVPGFEPAEPSSDVLEIQHPGGRRVRVGLVGVVMSDPTVYRRTPFGATEVLPANEAARLEAARLLREGCACVIPLTHQPLADDESLARLQRDPLFPVIVGGHEHEVLLEQVNETWIVKAGADAIHAAVIDLLWPIDPPPAGTPDLPIATVRMEEVSLYPEDLELRARVDNHMRRVHELETATLVRLAPGEVLSSVGTRTQQTSFGQLVCSRVRDAMEAEACLFNGGGIRGSHQYVGRVTYGDLKAEVPFDNEVVVIRLPGRVVRDAIAASRALAPAESGGFLQVDDGVTVTAAGAVGAIGGEPLDLERDYRVAIVRDLLLGLDHIEPLVRFAREEPGKIPPAGSGRGVKIVLVDAFAVALWGTLGGFDAVDANHDGVVTEQEIEAAVARANAEAPSHLTADLVIHALDVNHDQLISRSEADAAASHHPHAPPEPKLKPGGP